MIKGRSRRRVKNPKLTFLSMQKHHPFFKGINCTGQQCAIAPFVDNGYKTVKNFSLLSIPPQRHRPALCITSQNFTFLNQRQNSSSQPAKWRKKSFKFSDQIDHSRDTANSDKCPNSRLLSELMLLRFAHTNHQSLPFISLQIN